MAKIILLNNAFYKSDCNEPEIDLFYPRAGNDNATHIQVGLSDVRSADSIRISYDFDRNGYVIEQASIFSWDVDDTEMNSDWQEVAFIQAWGREGQELMEDK